MEQIWENLALMRCGGVKSFMRTREIAALHYSLQNLSKLKEGQSLSAEWYHTQTRNLHLVTLYVEVQHSKDYDM